MTTVLIAVAIVALFIIFVLIVASWIVADRRDDEDLLP